MRPYYQEPLATLYNGQVMNVLQCLPADSVQCVVTSPPYWGLRKYDGSQDCVWDGNKDCEHEWGGDILREAQRGGPSGTASEKQKSNAGTVDQMQEKRNCGNICAKCNAWRGAYGLEPTIELYIQHSVEILSEIKRVLRPDGICWWNVGDSYAGSGQGASENPEVVANAKEVYNVGKKHEKILNGIKPKDLCLIPERLAVALQEDGWWIRSRIVWAKSNPMPESVKDRPANAHETIWMLTKSARYYFDMEAVKEKANYPNEGKWSQTDNKGYQNNQDMAARKLHEYVNDMGRNIRDVWEINTQPFRDAHFAVFPETIPEKCILASTKPGDIVLDPFGGSGTTSAVAKRLNRKSIYIDVSEKYCNMAKKRISNVPLPMDLNV